MSSWQHCLLHGTRYSIRRIFSYDFYIWLAIEKVIEVFLCSLCPFHVERDYRILSYWSDDPTMWSPNSLSSKCFRCELHGWYANLSSQWPWYSKKELQLSDVNTCKLLHCYLHGHSNFVLNKSEISMIYVLIIMTRFKPNSNNLRSGLADLD